MIEDRGWKKEWRRMVDRGMRMERELISSS
jgi:hypothetical protein